MADLVALHDAMHGKVRGHPVGISLFYDEIPAAYEGAKVDPCAIVRLAMDHEKICYIDREHQACMTGAFTAGVHEASVEIRTGQCMSKNRPAITDLAAARSKVGQYVLPQGMLRAIGAAPLNNVPQGVKVDWICVVCNPRWANWIGGARSVLDGTPPHGSAGTAFCSDLFSVPWHTDNVVITPGGIGGRVNNRLKPEEMFVIVPIKYSDSLLKILAVGIDDIDARVTREATRPPD
jgi:uncharacterized protein (DUF169 family)